MAIQRRESFVLFYGIGNLVSEMMNVDNNIFYTVLLQVFNIPLQQ